MKYTGERWLNGEESYLRGEYPENIRGTGFGEMLGRRENTSTITAIVSVMFFIHIGTFNCLF